MVEAESFDWSQELAPLVVRAAQRVKDNFAQSISTIDIPVPQARALLLLSKPEPMSSLAGGLGCDQSYVTRIADELEQRGLVRRESGVDRRVQLLALTASGETMRDRIAELVTRHSVVRNALSIDDQMTLRRILGLVIATSVATD